MGLITGLMTFLFGDGRNVVAETAEVFRENAEKGAVREAEARSESLQQFAAEFMHPRRGLFDRIVDALNRLPRPMLALGTLGLFVYAMVDPDSFTRRMVGLNYVPEPLWWLLAAIVGFYFGAREAHYFRRPAKIAAPPPNAPAKSDDNPALNEWRRREDR